MTIYFMYVTESTVFCLTIIFYILLLLNATSS